MSADNTGCGERHRHAIIIVCSHQLGTGPSLRKGVGLLETHDKASRFSLGVVNKRDHVERDRRANSNSRDRQKKQMLTEKEISVLYRI